MRPTAQDEIDIEWLSGSPATGPVAYWTNHFVNGRRSGNVEGIATYVDGHLRWGWPGEGSRGRRAARRPAAASTSGEPAASDHY